MHIQIKQIHTFKCYYVHRPCQQGYIRNFSEEGNWFAQRLSFQSTLIPSEYHMHILPVQNFFTAFDMFTIKWSGREIINVF